MNNEKINEKNVFSCRYKILIKPLFLEYFLKYELFVNVIYRLIKKRK